MFVALLVGLGLVVSVVVGLVSRRRAAVKPPIKPLSVNYHFTRQCNYACQFCFHTTLSPDRELLDFETKIKPTIKALQDEGMGKINFSGGEPFLQPKLLGMMVDYCHKIGVRVTIVSNGSLLREDWLQKHAKAVDYLAISCDSFDDELNQQVGRVAQKSAAEPQSQVLRRVAELCQQYGVLLKINTVVHAGNWQEDMTAQLAELSPKRWKVFQVLPVDGENAGENPTNRDIKGLLITPDQFRSFIDRHRDLNPVPEDNNTMRSSYLILDEKLRFLNCTGGNKLPTRSVLEIGVPAALRDAGWDQASFHQRGGVYEFDKTRLLQLESAKPGCSAGVPGAAIDIEDL